MDSDDSDGIAPTYLWVFYKPILRSGDQKTDIYTEKNKY